MLVFTVTYVEIFLGDRFQQGVLGGDQAEKLQEAPKIYYSEITYFWLKYTLHNLWWN